MRRTGLRALSQLRLSSQAGWQAHCRAFSAAPAPAEDLIEVTVDGQPVKVPKGSNVLQACDAAGVDIPRCEPNALCRWGGVGAAMGHAGAARGTQ